MLVPSATFRLLIIAVAGLVCAGVAVGYVIITLNQNRLLLETQIAQIQQTQAQEAAFIQLRRLAEQSEAERAELQTFVLTQQNDAIVPLSLIEEEWGPQLGVKAVPTGISTKAAEPHNWLVLQFSLEGSAVGVRTMIQLLEQLPYVSELTAVSLQESDRGMTTAAVTVQIALLELPS